MGACQQFSLYSNIYHCLKLSYKHLLMSRWGGLKAVLIIFPWRSNFCNLFFKSGLYKYISFYQKNNRLRTIHTDTIEISFVSITNKDTSDDTKQCWHLLLGDNALTSWRFTIMQDVVEHKCFLPHVKLNLKTLTKRIVNLGRNL